MITENVNDDMDISVALCSDGKLSWSLASVRICRASSAMEEMNPPSVINAAMEVCSSNTPAMTPQVHMINYRTYLALFAFKMSFAPAMPPSSIMKSAIIKIAIEISYASFGRVRDVFLKQTSQYLARGIFKL